MIFVSAAPSIVVSHGQFCTYCALPELLLASRLTRHRPALQIEACLADLESFHPHGAAKYILDIAGAGRRVAQGKAIDVLLTRTLAELASRACGISQPAPESCRTAHVLLAPKLCDVPHQ